MKRLCILIFAVATGLASQARAVAEEALPLFDAHMHYNVEAREVLSPAQVIARLAKARGMSTSLDKVEAMFAQYPSLYGELSYRGDLEANGARHPRWSEVPQVVAFYRRMLAGLPSDVAEKIAYRNGVAMFGLEMLGK